jgi:hypothetical protein
MAILYKLTTQDGYTRKGESNQCLWGPGVSHSGTGEGDLCGPGFIHAYTHPLLAVLLNPIHASIGNPLLWECEGDVVREDKGLKVGCVTLTTLRAIDLPVFTPEQRVKFAILCAKTCCSDAVWLTWAEKWLSGDDRSLSAATAAAARAEARAAVWATWAAAAAAAAGWAEAAEARAARAAEAARAAPINLIALAEQAIS